MKKILLLLLFIASLNAEEFKPNYPDFDVALSRYGEHQVAYFNTFNKMTSSNFSDHLWKKDFYTFNQRLYNRNQEAPYKSDTSKHIPKIIHQIWLGNPLPELYKIWMKTWANLKGWEYKLWTDAEAEKFEFTHPDLYKNAKNYGERANILRYEVLHRYGGLYVDVDMECIDIEFFDYAHSHFDLYVGIEPLDHGFLICNAVVGAIPNHPLLTKMIKDMPSYHEMIVKDKNYKKVNFFGPTYISKKLMEYGVRNKTVDMVFPSTFFYPISISQVKAKSWDAAQHTFPETAAIHWWDGGWLKPQAQLKKD